MGSWVGYKVCIGQMIKKPSIAYYSVSYTEFTKLLKTNDENNYFIHNELYDSLT